MMREMYCFLYIVFHRSNREKLVLIHTVKKFYSEIVPSGINLNDIIIVGYVGDTIEVFQRDSLFSDKLSSEISKKSTESVRSSISSITCVSESLRSSEREILDPHDEFESKLDSLLKYNIKTDCVKNISNRFDCDCTTGSKDLDVNYMNEPLVPSGSEYEPFSSSSETSEERFHLEGIRPLRTKNSARERPTICPICFDDVMTHFTRHLFRHHKKDPCVHKILKLSPKYKERLALVSSMRKQGYLYMRTEKNIENPVRRSKQIDNSVTKHFVCTYCLATAERASRNCLARSQTFLATLISKNQDFLQSSRIKEEEFGLMRADDISYTAKSDPLICLYGETLLKKYKRQQICTTISNKMREIAKMLIALKDISSSVHMLFDAIKPGMFQDIIPATKVVSGYDSMKKSYKSSSLALHMGTNLKLLCDNALKIVIESEFYKKLNWRTEI
ncbi:hypothetical protein HHI36_022348 [Cryptolaemus montrouzieri]|uniref:Uncharacterized protein n=1 Tax=Cryptolaemus montrouzieri TaxID=559131 RepID=A0ABD2MZF8_9CUCU